MAMEGAEQHCLSEKNRKLVVAIFGTSLSLGITTVLILLLNRIKG